MKRVLLGFALACLLAVGAGRVTRWTPACVLYTPDDPPYWILFCWVDPPPRNPGA